MATPNRPTSPHSAALGLAHQALQAGALGQAETILRQAGVQGPPTFEVLHLLAVVLLQMGRQGEALPVIDSALALSPRSADGHGLRGLILNGLQQRDAAEAALRHALSIKSSASEIWFNLGLILADGGKAADAVAAFRKALRGGQDPDVLHRLGLSLLAVGKPDEAIAALRRAHQLRRHSADILIGLSMAFDRNGDSKAMKACHRLAALIDPGTAVSAHNLAVGYDRDGQVEVAVAWFKRALVVDAAYGPSQDALISLLLRSGQRERAATEQAGIVDRNPMQLSGHIKLVALVLESDSLIFALALLERLLQIWPDEPAAIGFLAEFYSRCAQPELGLRYARRASWISPGNAFARLCLAGCLTALGRSMEALALLDDIVAASPQYLPARRLRATTLLGMGVLARGWDEYESRESLIDLQPPLAPGIPMWNGDRGNHRILVRREQGIGDELMFMTCYPDVLERSGNVVLECEGRLASLLKRSYPQTTVCPISEVGQVEADVQIVAGSLPRLLRPRLDSFPDRPCLTADPERIAHWRQRLKPYENTLKVGFSWRSIRVRSNPENLRYPSLDRWVPLFQLPGVTYFSLQYDHTLEEETAIQRKFANIVTFPEVDMRNDIETVSAIMMNLDLVVSVANSVAGLAGALGVAGYQFTVEGDWTMLGTDTLPWIRNIEPLIRRGDEAGWERVLGDAACRVADRAAQRSHR